MPEKSQNEIFKKMNLMAEKFQNILENGSDSNAYAIERKIMVEKMEEMMRDMKICQENVKDFEKVVKALCVKNQILKKENDHLSHENKRLFFKTMSLDEVKGDLIKEKAKNCELMKRLENVKKDVLQFFEAEAIEEGKEKKLFFEMKNERKNLKQIFEKIHNFDNEAKIDKLMKDPKVLNSIQKFGKNFFLKFFSQIFLSNFYS